MYISSSHICCDQDLRIACSAEDYCTFLQVLSLGDSRSYFLGTAKNELGVVYAKHPTSGTDDPVECLEAENQLQAGSRC